MYALYTAESASCFNTQVYNVSKHALETYKDSTLFCGYTIKEFKARYHSVYKEITTHTTFSLVAFNLQCKHAAKICIAISTVFSGRTLPKKSSRNEITSFRTKETYGHYNLTLY